MHYPEPICDFFANIYDIYHEYFTIGNDSYILKKWEDGYRLSREYKPFDLYVQVAQNPHGMDNIVNYIRKECEERNSVVTAQVGPEGFTRDFTIDFCTLLSSEPLTKAVRH